MSEHFDREDLTLIKVALANQARLIQQAIGAGLLNKPAEDAARIAESRCIALVHALDVLLTVEELKTTNPLGGKEKKS